MLYEPKESKVDSRLLGGVDADYMQRKRGFYKIILLFVAVVVLAIAILFVVELLLVDGDHNGNDSNNGTVPTIRREIRTLTAAELEKYFNAVSVYKHEGRRDGRSYMKTYDEAVAFHALATANTTVDQAHFWAAFLVFHACYLREYELALQSIDPDVALPYWDHTIDGDSLQADPSYTSPVFTDAYFGTSDRTSGESRVNTSAVAYFPVSSDPLSLVWWQSPNGYLRSPTNYNNASTITRRVGFPPGEGTLPTSALFRRCADSGSYSDLWVCVWGVPGTRNESALHGLTHRYVGGSWMNAANQTVNGEMHDMRTSPNDPIFFSFHANIERLYYLWRQTAGDALATADDPCGVYYGVAVNTTSPQPPGHNLHDVFTPNFFTFNAADPPLTIAQACYHLQTQRCPYTYA